MPQRLPVRFFWVRPNLVDLGDFAEIFKNSAALSEDEAAAARDGHNRKVIGRCGACGGRYCLNAFSCYLGLYREDPQYGTIESVCPSCGCEMYFDELPMRPCLCVQARRYERQGRPLSPMARRH